MGAAKQEESVNPNEDLTSDEEVRGETSGSWDDLDHEVGPAEKPKAVKEAKAGKKKKDETEDFEDGEETLDDDDDDDDYEEAEKEDDKKKPEPKVRGRAITMLNKKGEETKVLASNTVGVKMDGEIQQVPVSDLVDSYSGKVVYDQKFSDLGRERSEFTERLHTLNDYVQNIFDTAGKIEESENKVETAYEVIRMIAGLSGGNSKLLTKQLSDVFINEGVGLSGMDERDRENWDLRREIELGKMDSDITQRISEGADLSRQTRTQNAELMETYSISDERAKDIAADLADYSSDEVTPELIIRFDRLAMAMDAISEVRPNANGDVELRNKLTRFAIDDPSLTKQDLEYILKESQGENSQDGDDDSNENLSRKVRGNQRKPRKKARKSENKPERVFSRSEDMWGDLD